MPPKATPCTTLLPLHFPLITLHLRPRPLTYLTIAGLLLLLGTCNRPPHPGEALARTYCTGCHGFPGPDRLSKRVWRTEVLPLMGVFLGVPGGRVVESGSANVFPRRPQLTGEEWADIQQWYLREAPDTLASAAEDREEIAVGLRHFRTRFPEVGEALPLTTLVRIDTARRRLAVAELGEAASSLHLYHPASGETTQVPLDRPLADLDFVGDDLYLTALGDLIASDRAWGALEAIRSASVTGGYGRVETLIPELQRPVQSLRLDVDEDGDQDWIIAEFGKYSGSLSWWEAVAGGQWQRHEILPLPGAVRMALTDHDGDGRQDLMVAFGQGDERISVFLRDGQGGFRERRLLEFPPTNGTVSFELADFNGDGRQDVLYVNGDNADYDDPGLKPYHGFTIYLRGRDDTYTEAYRFPTNGAYGARVADFDLDGDPDIATIAFFPDYSLAPTESFVYLENVGGVGEQLRFSPSTFREYSAGRYLVMDSGDVDGDGDEDIVLGSYTDFALDHDVNGLRERWRERGPAVVWLENTVR